MSLGPLELTIVLVIVLLLFGAGRIGKLGGELGSAIANFRQGLASSETAALEADIQAAEEQVTRQTEALLDEG